MVDIIVNDIRKALENDLFMVALTTALTLPDVCGKVAFPNEGNNKRRYISWFDTEITSKKYANQDDESCDMPRLNGSIVYSLRCSLLHEGNPNIDNREIAKNGTKPIDHFILTKEHNGELVVCLNVGKVSADGTRTYSVSIRGLCYNICDAAEKYYKANKDKFNFDYELDDRDEKLRDLLNFAKRLNAQTRK